MPIGSESLGVVLLARCESSSSRPERSVGDDAEAASKRLWPLLFEHGSSQTRVLGM
jgi:hypothetical protein